MNSRSDIEPTSLDTVKLFLASAILLGGIVAYYYFAEQPIWLRFLAVIAAVALGIVVAMQSFHGRELWHFVQGSRVEIRKVIWPSRQETLTTAGAVLLVAFLMGIFFWLLDMFLVWATRILTGQGG